MSKPGPKITFSKTEQDLFMPMYKQGFQNKSNEEITRKLGASGCTIERFKKFVEFANLMVNNRQQKTEVARLTEQRKDIQVQSEAREERKEQLKQKMTQQGAQLSTLQNEIEQAQAKKAQLLNGVEQKQERLNNTGKEINTLNQYSSQLGKQINKKEQKIQDSQNTTVQSLTNKISQLTV